jgi:hypothetical protein
VPSWQAYRITSFAWKRSDGGIVRPRAWAVLRLMTRVYRAARSMTEPGILVGLDEIARSF